MYKTNQIGFLCFVSFEHSHFWCSSSSCYAVMVSVVRSPLSSFPPSSFQNINLQPDFHCDINHLTQSAVNIYKELFTNPDCVLGLSPGSIKASVSAFTLLKGTHNVISCRDGLKYLIYLILIWHIMQIKERAIHGGYRVQAWLLLVWLIFLLPLSATNHAGQAANKHDQNLEIICRYTVFTSGGCFLTTSTSCEIFSPKRTVMVSLACWTGRTHFW